MCQQLACVRIPHPHGNGVALAHTHLWGKAQRFLDFVPVDDRLPHLRDPLPLVGDVDLDSTGTPEQIGALVVLAEKSIRPKRLTTEDAESSTIRRV